MRFRLRFLPRSRTHELAPVFVRRCCEVKVDAFIHRKAAGRRREVTRATLVLAVCRAKLGKLSGNKIVELGVRSQSISTT